MNFQSLRDFKQNFSEIITKSYWRRRSLRQVSGRIMTNGYWRRRERSADRRFKVLRVKYHTATSFSNLTTSVAIIRRGVIGTLKASLFGVLLIGGVMAMEALLIRHAGLPVLLPKSSAPFGTFPGLAAQILAALLGFYLATVGIVLGNAYQDVADSVRQLVLRNAVTERYLRIVGMSIGAGLAIVLLQSLQIVWFGYLSIAAYALLVALSAWALATLAIGAFNLLNPISLGGEPLLGLYQAISRIDSKGFHADDPVLNVTASKADDDLSTLAELIRLTKDRKSVSRVGLVRMVTGLLVELESYSQKKHHLSPDSRWFRKRVAYPRWVESEHSARSMALKTSMPLEPQEEPMPDWLERRVAVLVSAAIEACVATEDKEQALIVIRKVGLTARVLANEGRVDEATDFANVVTEGCRNIDVNSDVVAIVYADFPTVFSNILMGWRDAIDQWPEEIERVVYATDWDNPKTRMVQIRGPERLRQTAQTLLYQISSEHSIEGKRITPDWYIQSVLAWECIQSVREFLDQFTDRIGQVVRVARVEEMSPNHQAVLGTQSLQMLSRADYIIDSMSDLVADLESLREGFNPTSMPEIETTSEVIKTYRFVVLDALAETLTQLAPEGTKDEPDYFGDALYRLTHYAEEAIAGGDQALVTSIFPSTLSATMKLHDYMLRTYRPPTYEITPGVFDPFLDILDLSGFALIYEAIRGDQSAEPVRNAWGNWINDAADPKRAATRILDHLDIVDSTFTVISQMRTEWEMRAAQEIIRAGYDRPEPALFLPDEPPESPMWNAPPLIKMLMVSEHMPSLNLDPYVIFAAEVVSPLSGEDESILRERPGLRRYFEVADRHRNIESEQEVDANESVGECM